MNRYLSADEAAAILGISKATLYAYVSRHLIRSEEAGSGSRARRYLAEDVQKLRDRKEYRRDPAQVAQDALHWGTPLLDSSLTLITDLGLYYRGVSAVTLAQTATIEQVAALLWTGDSSQSDALFAARPDSATVLSRLDPDLPPMQRVTVALALVDDLAAYDLRPESVTRTGIRILALVAAALTMQPLQPNIRLAQHLATAWQPAASHLPRLIDAALILCADHELNVSSFTARVVASADAHPYAVVTAGLAALSGFKHGGSTERVAALFREIGSPQHITTIIADRLRRGEAIPGFGHSLYPNGDPRAAALLALLEAAYPQSTDLQFAFDVAGQVSAIIGQPPNIDFALVALKHTAQLPPGSPLALFALGRTVGWIGHAIEQYASGALIRPRARYIGASPSEH